MTTNEVEKANFDELVASLKPVEAELAQRGSKFFGGQLINNIHYIFYLYENDY